ncbi:MAG: ABC transporter ATP-binding protein [Acidimicrobiales bacterium]
MSIGPATPMLEMTGITKRFGEVVANEGVDLTVLPGQVHTLLGENGAGKSTLMKILYGLYRPDEGQIKIDGATVEITSPSDAIDRGIGMIHQHFMLVPTLTVAENVALGLRSPLSGADMAPIKTKLAEVSERYRLNVDPDAYIWQLAVGERQRAEILKALYRDARLLVLDEPTAVLTPPEVEDLFTTLRQMTADERGLIFISHKLHEVMDLSDEITVLRDGRVTGATRPSEATRESLAELMVGRPVDLTRTLPNVDQGAAKLTVSDLTVRGDRGLVAVDGVSFEVRAGEIVGIAGVSGNGQRELAEAIVGLRPIDSGELVVDGQPVANPTPKGVRARGVSYVPEERMVHGAIADFTVAENLMLLDYAEEPYTKHGLLNLGAIADRCQDLVSRFSVKTPSIDAPTRNLSGGNIQKVVIARELSCGSGVLVAAQPTRGVDIGAAEYIHEQLLSQRSSEVAILLISEDLDEVLGMSDRVIVLFEGRVMGVIDRDLATKESIGLLMSGVATPTTDVATSDVPTSDVPTSDVPTTDGDP